MSRTINGVEFPTPEPALLQTTLNLAKAADECGAGLGITKELGLGPDDPANLLDVLRVGGVDNALWCLRCVLPWQEVARDRAARLIAAECAARVLHTHEAKHPDDDRPRRAIEAARDFALGLIDAEALKSAVDESKAAAGGAAWYEARTAWASVGDAAWCAAVTAAARAIWASGASERKAQTEILRAYLKGGEA